MIQLYTTIFKRQKNIKLKIKNTKTHRHAETQTQTINLSYVNKPPSVIAAWQALYRHSTSPHCSSLTMRSVGQ